MNHLAIARPLICALAMLAAAATRIVQAAAMRRATMREKSRWCVKNAYLRTVLAAGMFAAGLASAQVPPGYEPARIGDSGCNMFQRKNSIEHNVSWSGACRDGFAQGQGILRGEAKQDNGTMVPFTVEGNYDRGLRHGFSRKTYEGGLILAGNYRNDQLNGWGYQRFSNGNTFEGQFVDGLRHGMGTLTASAGAVVGRWEKNKPVGARQSLYKDGARSTFVDEGNGRENGIYDSGYGDIRAGDFANSNNLSKLDGSGLFWFADRTPFFGTFKNDRPHGPGVWVKFDSENREDATLKGGNYDDGCLWRGKYSVSINRPNDPCKR